MTSRVEWFLNRHKHEEWLRLVQVLRRISARSFPGDQFRAKLLEKLNSSEYYRDNCNPDGETFFEVLRKTDRLNVLLCQSIMIRLWKYLWIPEAIETDLELEERGLTPAGTRIKFHASVARLGSKHLKELKEHKIDPSSVGYIPILEKNIEEHSQKGNVSRGPALRQELLNGRRSTSIRTQVQQADKAAQRGIYRVLRDELQNEEAKKNGISNRFIRQLTILVAQSPQVKGPSVADDTMPVEDEALRKFLERRKKRK
jgi:hypothetical protein